MNDIVEKVLAHVKERIEWHKNTADDHYDFWKEHIKYVYEEATKLAKEYGADEEIVSLGALLHDIALIERVGTRADHNETGAKIAKEVLTKFEYPEERMNRVVGCVLHHRSSKNAENIEETCVADADVLAHFDNIPLLFAIQLEHLGLAQVGEEFKKYAEKDFNDLSEATKKNFEERYKTIIDVVVPK